MPAPDKLVFDNGRGQMLAAQLDLPPGEPLGWAIFAHCFTCSKDVPAAGRISRRLAQEGLAVLRFDFTGLGSSEGDFANTNFSSNVDDLVAAAAHLREHHEAPALLVGHSLGGAAVLVAARRIDEVRAVCTIAAPSEPEHVRRLLTGDVDEIESKGVATVDIAGREFRIEKQFLDDLGRHALGEELGALRKPLLIFHSPVDEVVGIDHARRIYEAARGSKSFVSLENANHLLGDVRDARYVAEVLAAWVSRYLEERPVAASRARPDLAPGQVLVEEVERPYTNRVVAGRHELLADEPPSVGGRDAGPTPYDYLLAGLGACTSMTLRMYADRKGWPLEGVSVRLSHQRIHAEDCAECESETGFVDRIERDIRVEGPALDEEQRARLLEIANRCPVHRTLLNEKQIPTRLTGGPSPSPRLGAQNE
jgi:putative redox protein